MPVQKNVWKHIEFTTYIYNVRYIKKHYACKAKFAYKHLCHTLKIRLKQKYIPTNYSLTDHTYKNKILHKITISVDIP